MIPRERTVNLTDAQADELLDVGLAYLQHIIGFSLADPAVLYMHQVSGYLTLLAVAALVENRTHHNGTNHVLLAREARLRRETMRALGEHLGRPAAADDVIQAVSAVLPIPDAIADAVLRDFAAAG